MESILLSALTKDNRDGFGLGKAILQAVDMLVQQGGSATLCHVFVITGNRNCTTFSLPMIDARVGLHTISLDPQFRLYGSEAPYGWHIYTEDYSNAQVIAEGTLRDKIQMVIAHLHTGVDSGTAKDLRLSLVPGDGCQIESIYGNTFCKDLRPGEKWTISAKIRVPAASGKQFMPHKNQTNAEICARNQHRTVEELMDQLQHMLDTCLPETDQILMTVFLGYRHSLLPKSHIVRVSECCNVVRSLRRDSGCVVDSLEDYQPVVDTSIFRLRNITESSCLTENTQILRKPSSMQLSNGDSLSETCGGKPSFMEHLLHLDNNQVSTSTEKIPEVVVQGIFDDSSNPGNREHERYDIDLMDVPDDCLGDVRSGGSICSFENVEPKTGNRTWGSNWLLE
jgi:hypothetical protein